MGLTYVFHQIPIVDEPEFGKTIHPIPIALKISDQIRICPVGNRVPGPIKQEKDMDLSILRHSVSHIMAQAVKEIWPDAKLGIGPSIDDGFYYDFDKKEPFAPEDIEKIEKKMNHIIKQNLKFQREELDKKDAIKLFKALKEKYKVELLEEIPDEKVTVYRQGDFVDLCRGPHLESTGKAKAFKLLSIAGAYWKGSEKNPMLTRIYGTVFASQKGLDTENLIVKSAVAKKGPKTFHYGRKRGTKAKRTHVEVVVESAKKNAGEKKAAEEKPKQA